MSKNKKSTIQVQGTAIAIVSSSEHDFISLTDMGKKCGWEQIHNPDSKGLEFDTFRKQASLH